MYYYIVLLLAFLVAFAVGHFLYTTQTRTLDMVGEMHDLLFYEDETDDAPP